MTPIIRKLRIFGLAVLLAAGCASANRVADGPRASAYAILVDGRFIATAGDDNLLDVLRRRYTPTSLGEYAGRPEDAPLVMVDGTRFHNVRWLAGIHASNVASVERLRPTDAVLTYGSRARMGAIIVSTRLGGR